MTAMESSYNPSDGSVTTRQPVSTAEEVDRVVAAARAAAPDLAAASPQQRRTWLAAVADALVEHRDELAQLADQETALGLPRLTGEVERVAGQLRFYADVAVEGSFLAATIDSAGDDGEVSLARVGTPLGPVAVFGASNFPFAFGILGNDTASALAAGCPVVVKAHPAHLGLSRRLIEIAIEAWQGPPGSLGIVFGFEAGTTLVRHRDIGAVAFTGSQAGGMALWRLANERETVIPVYAEMGTVNPVVVTPAAADDMAAIAEGFVASFTAGFGQFCTKPGLLLVPSGSGAAALVGDALTAAAPKPHLLTSGIAAAVQNGLTQAQEAGARLVARVDGPGTGWSSDAAVLSADTAQIVPGSRLTEEVFGPVALVVEYQSVTEVGELVARLQGALAASVFTGGTDDPDVASIVSALSARVGRVIANAWPTGVAFTWAQHHGGPWPATSNPATSSVGAGALARFVRPVAYQGMPDELLPPALQAANPWGVTRWINGQVTSGEGA